MEITVEPIEPRQVQLTVVVPPERVDEAMQALAQQYGRRLKIPGYRPGHVPYKVLETHLDTEVLRAEAVERVAELSLREAMKQEELTPFADVSIEVQNQDPLTFTALVPLVPTVDLRDYRTVRALPPEMPEVTEDDIDAAMQDWLQSLAVLAPVDRPSEAGDTLSLSLEGKLGDEVIYEDDALSLELVPEKMLAADLPHEVIDELIGLKAGDRHSFQVSYSEFWEDVALQGKTADFEADVISVLALRVPELDDELAKQAAGAESAAALRDRARDQLEFQHLRAFDDERIKAAMDALVAHADVSFPPIAVDREVANMLADLRRRVEQQGFAWERWLELQGKDEDTLWDEAEPEAEARLIRSLVLSAVAEAEKVGLTTHELDLTMVHMDALLGDVKGRQRRTATDTLRREVASRMLTDRTLARMVAITMGEADEADEADEEPGSGTDTIDLNIGQPIAAAADSDPERTNHVE